MGQVIEILNPNDGLNDEVIANDEKGALWGEEETVSANMDDKATVSDEGGSEVTNDGGVDEDMGGSMNNVEGSKNNIKKSMNKGSFHNHLALKGMEQIVEMTTVKEVGLELLTSHHYYK